MVLLDDASRGNGVGNNSGRLYPMPGRSYPGKTPTPGTIYVKSRGQSVLPIWFELPVDQQTQYKITGLVFSSNPDDPDGKENFVGGQPLDDGSFHVTDIFSNCANDAWDFDVKIVQLQNDGTKIPGTIDPSIENTNED